MPMMLFAFAWAHCLPMSLLLLVGIGWSFMMVIINNNAIIQTEVPDALRGRVMSVYTLVFFGSMPLGSLFAGTVAENFGEPPTVMLGAGVLMIMAIAVWFFLPIIRKTE
jgi:predicted MFS family arabinose efflux permease